MTLEGWNYRKSHVITHTSITDYQTKIRVYRTTGTDSGDTVYVGDKCLADFGDIRFTNVMGTELSYWMEVNAGTYADFWVKLDTITTSATFYIYYGNSSASTTSNGNTTFVFFDDFDGMTLDSNKWNTADWQGSGGTEAVTSGYLQITSIASNKRVVYGKTQYSTGILEVYGSYISPDTGYNWGGAGFANSNTAGYWSELIYTTYKGYRYEIGNTTAGSLTAVSWTSAYYKAVLTGSTVNLYIKNAYTDSWITLLSGQSNTTAFYPAIAGYDDKASGNGNFQIDYTFVRQYSATEPTHSTWGAEEDIGATSFTIRITPTTGTDPLSVTYNCIIPEGTLNNFTLSYGDGSEYTVASQSSFATTHVYNEPGTYTVWGEGYTEFATHVYYEIPYGVNVSAPAITTYYTFNQTYNTIQFHDETIGTPTEWYWTFGDGSHSYEQHPIHTYNVVGTYQVMLYSSNQYQYDWSSSYVNITQILTPPSAYFTPARLDVINPTLPYNVTFTNLSTPSFGCTYNWTVDGGTVSTSQNPSISFATHGVYDIGLTVTNSLGSSTRTYIDAIRLTRKSRTMNEVVGGSDSFATFGVQVFMECATGSDLPIVYATILPEGVYFIQREIPDVPGIDEWGVRHLYSTINEWGVRIFTALNSLGHKILHNSSSVDRTPLKCIDVEIFEETITIADDHQFDEDPS